MENTNVQASSSQIQAPPSTSSIPQQTNTQQLSPGIQPEESKPNQKFKLIFIIFGLFVFLLLSSFAVGCFLKEYLIQQKPNEQVVNRTGEEEAEIKPEPDISGWKVNECIYEGYKISYPGDMTPHNVFPGDNSCVSQYGYWGPEEPIFIGFSDEKISADEDHIIHSEKEITINGIKARYLEMEINRDLEMKQFRIYEYPGNGKYYHLYLNLDYHDPRQDLDFYEDGEWGQMVDELNKEQNLTNEVQYITASDINDIFHKMAQTFQLITPRPISVSDLEACLNAAQKNLRDNEIKISKPTGNQNEYSYTKEEYDVIYFQYKIETNLCYRKYKEEGMKDCFQLYPDDPNKEYECNIDNTEPVFKLF